VLPNVEVEERRRLVREGTLSALALLWPFRPLDRFPARLVETEARGVPVLDRRTKTSGAANYNHAAYLRLSRLYAEDALTVIRRRPDAYLQGIGIGAGRFFEAGTDDPAFRGNRQRLGAWAAAYERLFARAALPGGVQVSAMMVLYLLAVAYGVWRLAAGVRRERRLDPEAASLAYALLTIAYVAAVWVATDNGETFRARMLIEPLVLFVLLPLAVRAGLEAARKPLPTAAGRP
jgi:hypothetical protein